MKQYIKASEMLYDTLGVWVGKSFTEYSIQRYYPYKEYPELIWINHKAFPRINIMNCPSKLVGDLPPKKNGIVRALKKCYNMILNLTRKGKICYKYH